MARRRRYLVRPEMLASLEEGFLADQEERFQACPEAGQYTDEDAEDFLAAGLYLDSADQATIVEGLRRAKIPFPIDLSFDDYRLGRYLLRRWRDPALREAFLRRAMALDYGMIAKLKRRGEMRELLAFADQCTPPAALAVLRLQGMSHLIPALVEAFSPFQTAQYRGLLLCGKLLLHRFLTEREPPRRPSRWEQKKLTRRLRLRDVQLRSMRRSLYTLRRERKALLARLRETGRPDQPQIDTLADELAELRAARVEAERQHAVALEAQTRRYQEAVDRLKEQMASALQDYNDMLAERSAWLSIDRRR